MNTQVAVPKSSERVSGLDLLRILGSIMVIVIHSGGLRPIGTTAFYAATLYDGLSRSVMSIFVMLSGTFLLDPKRSFSAKKFFKNHILHVFIAFLFWASLYAIHDLIVHTETFSFKTIVSFVFTVFSGFHHLWYLLMLLGLYLMVPFLRRICESDKLTLYYIALSVLFCNTAILLGELPFVGEQIEHLVSVIEPSFVLGFTGYFVMGYALRHFQIPKKWRFLMYAAGLLSSAFTVGGTLWLSLSSGEHVTVLNHNLILNNAVTGSALFVLFDHLSEIPWFTLSQRTKRFIARWSSLTFGIYLVHRFVLFATEDMPTLPISPFIMMPLKAALVYAVSYAITWVLKKIPVFNRYCV